MRHPLLITAIGITVTLAASPATRAEPLRDGETANSRWARCTDAAFAKVKADPTFAIWRATADCDRALPNDKANEAIREMDKEAAKWRKQSIKLRSLRCGSFPPLSLTSAAFRELADCQAAAGDEDGAKESRDWAAQREAAEEAAEARAKMANVAVGMTAEQVRHETRWGPPERISRTVTAGGVTERWEYGTAPRKSFLYFEKGFVTAIQEEEPGR